MRVEAARIINGKVTRPKPSAEWTFEWRRDPKRTDAMTRERTSVTASYAADTPAVLQDNGPDTDDGPELPNNVTITHGVDNNEQMRLTRGAAQSLIDALTSALAWDGK